jgi:hypothetical protein
LLRRQCQYLLGIDDARTGGLQANGDALVTPHDHLALTV